MAVTMAGRNIALIGVLLLARFTSYSSAKRTSYLSCLSSHVGDFVILDCYYRGGLPFPTLTWTGPNNLYRETTNTPRFTINITKDEFVDEWNTIYKCVAGHHYFSSYCYVGRGLGSYVGIAFGALALLVLLCIFLLVICAKCDQLCEKIARRRGKCSTSPATTTATGYENPTYAGEPVEEEKTPK
ncbi:uncharacterized protein LOC144671664 [Cetorhinus maximus]